MPELSRSQLIVYAAVAIALLLVGARAIRADGGSGPAEAGIAAASGGGDDFSVESSGATSSSTSPAPSDAPASTGCPPGPGWSMRSKRAGGAASGAVLEAINRAARLSDGQQVVVPSARPPPPQVVKRRPAGPIGLGGATVEQLETIDGIGPVTAQNIVEYRDQHGGLASVEQLDDVSGIGPATMESLRARLQP